MALKSWYDRHVMPRMITMACGQEGIEKRRRQVVPLAAGRVFELGCGGGLNQALYESDRITSFSGIDPHDKLLDGARRRARAKGWDFDIRQGIGEDIPFADGAFDTVVCTYTLCSVDDPARVLAELRRILAPGGKLLFLATTGAVFMAGAKILDCLKYEKAARLARAAEAPGPS